MCAPSYVSLQCVCFFLSLYLNVSVLTCDSSCAVFHALKIYPSPKNPGPPEGTFKFCHMCNMNELVQLYLIVSNCFLNKLLLTSPFFVKLKKMLNRTLNISLFSIVWHDRVH